MGLPDRWLEYKPIGKKVEGTRFIAFKVPLRDQVFESLPDEHHTTQDIMKKVPNLGMVINLTNTVSDSKYYDPKTWASDIQYLRLKCEGHKVPNRRLLKKFCRIVSEFMKNDPERLIGVHCTHGLNRTGYFICSYMTLCQNIDPNRAIKNFNKARYHEQERENYLEEVRLNAVDEELREDILYGPEDADEQVTHQQHQQHRRNPISTLIRFDTDSSYQNSYRMEEPPRFHPQRTERPYARQDRMDLPPPGIPDRSHFSWKRNANEDERNSSSRSDVSYLSRPPPLVGHRTSTSRWRAQPPALVSQNPRHYSSHRSNLLPAIPDLRNQSYEDYKLTPPVRTRFTKEPRREERREEFRPLERTRFTGNPPRLEHDRPRSSRYEEQRSNYREDYSATRKRARLDH